MKKIAEALGVPNNIYDVSVNVFNGIISNLKSKTPVEFIEDMDSDGQSHLTQMSVTLDMYINNIHIKRADISFKFTRIDDEMRDSIEGKYTLIRASESTRISRDIPTKSFIAERRNNLSIAMQIGYFGNIFHKDADGYYYIDDIESVIEYLNSQSKVFIPMITHEIKHMYDSQKNKRRDMLSAAQYDSYSSIRFPIKALNSLLFNLYYTTSVENIVRMSEMYANIKVNDVTKDKFKEFIEKSDLYNTFRQIGEFSVEKLRSDIKSDKNTDMLLKDVHPDHIFESDEEKVDEVLRIFYINLVNTQIDTFHHYLLESPLEELIGFLDSNKDVIFNEMIKTVSKYKDNIKGFYINCEKSFKQVANKYLKRLSKLYDLTEHSPEIKQTMQWNLHNKINKRGSDIKLESNRIITNFELFKNK